MILTEFDLRQKLLSFRSTHQKSVDDLLQVWNEKIARGVPVDKDAWYDLFGHQVEKSIQDEPIYSEVKEGASFFVSAGITVNRANPFMFEFIYKIDGHNKEGRFETVSSIGYESYIVGLHKELMTT